MVVERLDVTQSDDRLQVALHRSRYDFVLARVTPADSVLEIGTGVGAFTDELRRSCRRFVGVELDAQACLETRQRTGGQAPLARADAKALPFHDSQFSRVVCLEVLEHLGNYQAGLLNIHRCLMVDGMAILSVPYRRRGGNNPQNPWHRYEPGEGELVATLQELFREVEVYHQYFQESAFMTLARGLRIRRWVGLKNLYRDLSNGEPRALSRLRLGQNGRGMKMFLRNYSQSGHLYVPGEAGRRSLQRAVNSFRKRLK